MIAPLAGRRVLVTRAAHQAGKLSEGLRALGAAPVEVPVLEIHPPRNSQPLDNALRQLDIYDWLIFTSANTVRAVVERAAALGIASIKTSKHQSGTVLGNAPKEASGSRTGEGLKEHGSNIRNNEDVSRAAKKVAVLKGHGFSRAESRFEDKGALAPEGKLPKVAAIGEATAAAAGKAGLPVALVPESYVAESLVASMAALVAGKKILLTRAEVARDLIPDALRTAGAAVEVVDAYRNAMPESAPALLRTALQSGIDAATFTSSSSVSHLAEAARAAGLAFPFPGVRAVSIGPITSATLRECGWQPAAEASPSDISGLIAAVQKALL